MPQAGASRAIRSAAPRYAAYAAPGMPSGPGATFTASGRGGIGTCRGAGAAGASDGAGGRRSARPIAAWATSSGPGERCWSGTPGTAVSAPATPSSSAAAPAAAVAPRIRTIVPPGY